MSQQLRRYVQTLRHARPSQVSGRVAARLKQRARLTRIPAPPADLRAPWVPRIPFPAHDPWNTRPALLEGRFCFLHRRERLGWPPDWTAAGSPLLWRFNLHYFHFLHLLQPEEQVALCRAWVDGNPVGTQVAWHPYPTALRIINWCRAGLLERDLLASLYRQAAFLYRNIETYVYGNHLLENARALVLAGCFFEAQGEAPRWLETGLSIFREETREQILSDGGHYERSPMYHALMMEGYLDLLNVLPEGHADQPRLQETVCRMGDVLASLTHPDGRLALFNDATQEIAPSTNSLLAYLEALTGYVPKPRLAMQETGYFVHRSPDVYMVVDGGSVGPDHLMAHAHADIFSYELTLQGIQFIVDTGVYEYAAGPMRDFVRGTAAHNTVMVDAVDQVECWGSFRVARRMAPHGVSFHTEAGESRFEGTFAGYAKWIGDGIIHRRRMTVREGERIIEVKDHLGGRGRHLAESRIHLHPEVHVTAKAGCLALERGRVECQLTLGGSTYRLDDGWYCPQFGLKERNTVVVLGGEVTLPADLWYAITY